MSSVIVSSELDDDDMISIDGKLDSAWVSASAKESQVQSGASFTIRFAHDDENMYIFIIMGISYTSDESFETVALYLQSAQAVESVQQSAQQMDFPSSFGGFSGDFNPPSMDMGSFQDFERSELIEPDMLNMDDRKAITILGGFDNLYSQNYSVKTYDSYIYDNDDEDDPYSYELDIDSSDFEGAAYMDKYTRNYEFAFALDPDDSYNDINIADTEAFSITIGVVSDYFENENFSSSFRVQLFDPSVITTSSSGYDKYLRNGAIATFGVIIAVTFYGAFYINKSKNSLRKPSIKNAYGDIKKHFKEVEEYGDIRSKEEMAEIDKEEKRFLQWIED